MFAVMPRCGGRGGMWAIEPEGDLWLEPGAATQDMGALSPPRVLCCSQWNDCRLTPATVTAPDVARIPRIKPRDDAMNGTMVNSDDQRPPASFR
ncbi:hypothetical protein AAFF_G00360450 [Aldrovandia affinis]|uniref:Uncharacterized protein n=1 Tax=Aldrovandia affinis TaxID=143900 RepID=A0AAD7SIC2_9TELE|nr:hypothetical protein AAFF_G00360450 [Aldrovandia affinis]